MNTCEHDLRLATTKDARSVYRLVQHTIRSCYYEYYTPSIVEGFCRYHSLEAIATDIANDKVYVIEADDVIVATATLDGSYIGRVYVLPEEQGKGFGTLLMDAMEKLASEVGDVATLDSSTPGRELYLHRGYVVTGTETWEIDQTDELPADRLVYEIMEKRLPPK